MKVKKTKRVPFNKPVRFEQHGNLLASPDLISCIAGNGKCTKRVEQSFEQILDTPTRIVTSATHAMEMMALLLDIKPGDEVIVPSYTFVSTANAFVLRGASIRFADNDEFGNILPSEIERLANHSTRAVVAVHYAGASANMTELKALCETKRIVLLEDAAQGVGSSFLGQPLGTIGSLGCFSFHETKNITSGEGGALIFGDKQYIERADILREKGTNRSRFIQGLTDKYTWTDIGSSFVLSELSVAYLEPQVSRISEINSQRAKIHQRYLQELEGLFAGLEIKILGTPEYNQPNYHMFASIFATEAQRASFISWMSEREVNCPFHYVSLHTSPFGRKFYKGHPDHLPGCDRLSSRLVRFPLYFNMTLEEQDYVIACAWAKQQ